MTAPRVLSFDDAIDELMVLLDIQRPTRKGIGTTVPLSHFSRIETTFSDRYGVLNRTGGPGYFSDVTPAVVPAADVTTLRNAVDDDDEGHVIGHAFMVERFRFLRPHEYRGRVWKPMPYVASLALGILNVNGRFESFDQLIGTHDGFDWWCIGPTDRRMFHHYATTPGKEFWLDLKEQADRSTSTAELTEMLARVRRINREAEVDPDKHRQGLALRGTLGVALTNEYEWSVNVGHAGAATIRVPVSPPAVKELFRLRDIPEGRARRAALRHWVSSHWRRKHDDPRVEVEVRQHFRGVERFNWNGLICEVVPSKHDKGRVEVAMEEPPRHRVAEPDGRYRMVDLAIARAATLGATP